MFDNVIFNSQLRFPSGTLLSQGALVISKLGGMFKKSMLKENFSLPLETIALLKTPVVLVSGGGSMISVKRGTNLAWRGERVVRRVRHR